MPVKRLTMQTTWIATVFALTAAAAALAQEVPGPQGALAPASPAATTASARDGVLRARYQLRVMEGVLENAVQHGIRSVADRMRLVSPEIVFFGSPARARGFRLDGYGVFFDVEVPTLRPSVVWSMRQLSQMTPELSRALQALRRLVAAQGDPRTRSEVEQALRLVELRVDPLIGASSATGGAVAESERTPQSAPADPRDAYEREVTAAVVEAILDYGGTIGLQPEDWLAVAMRGNDAALGQDDIDAVTVLLRVRGRDLEGLRTGALTREQVRQRVSVSEF